MPSDQPSPPSQTGAVVDYLDERDAEADRYWRGLLTGETSLAPTSRVARAVFRHLPSAPRCKWCYAPYGAPFGPLLGRLGYGRWDKNPSLCQVCMTYMEKHQGGAEVDLAVMFADLRGSTQMAATMSPAAYSRLLNVFYGIAGDAIQGVGGIVDKYLGDGVLALFLPGYTDQGPATIAVTAASRILERVSAEAELPLEGRPLPVGIGVHYGQAYVGIVGQAGHPTDFTALGDAVNVAERVSSAAAAGELMVSDAAARELGRPLEGAERRELTLRGVDAPVPAWSVKPAERPSAAAR
ncbi:MAG: adenylate/guanylate cyclase domain-containing protein, partial [Candidatus Limnocylindrales bacterium]